MSSINLSVGRIVFIIVLIAVVLIATPFLLVMGYLFQQNLEIKQRDRKHQQLATIIVAAGGEIELASQGGTGGGRAFTYPTAYIDFSGTGLTDEKLSDLSETLQQLPSIEYLDLEGTQITDAGLKVLADLRNLAVVDVTNSSVSKEGITDVLSSIPVGSIFVVDNSQPNAIAFPDWKNIRPRSTRAEIRHYDSDLRFSPSGDQLAVAVGRRVHVLTIADAKVRELPVEGEFIDFSVDETKVVVTNVEGARIVALGSLQETQFFPNRSGYPRRACFSSDGKFVTVDSTFDSYRYDIDTGNLTRVFRAKNLVGRSRQDTFNLKAITGLVSPDGLDVSGKSYDQSAQQIRMGIISGDARLAAWIPKDSTDIHITDAQTGKLIKRIRTPGCSMGDFSSDASQMAVGAPNGVVLVFGIETEKLLFSHQDTAGPVKSVAISPDGQWVAAAFENGSIKWWHVGEGDDQAAFPRRLPSGSRDQTVKEMFEVFVSGERSMNYACLLFRFWILRRRARMADSFWARSSPRISSSIQRRFGWAASPRSGNRWSSSVLTTSPQTSFARSGFWADSDRPAAGREREALLFGSDCMLVIARIDILGLALTRTGTYVFQLQGLRRQHPSGCCS